MYSTDRIIYEAQQTCFFNGWQGVSNMQVVCKTSITSIVTALRWQ